jgi:hypothetical protein
MTQSKAGKKRFKGSQAAKTRLQGMQECTQRQPRKDSKAANKRLKGRQEKTQRQASKDSKADK